MEIRRVTRDREGPLLVLLLVVCILWPFLQRLYWEFQVYRLYKRTVKQRWVVFFPFFLNGNDRGDGGFKNVFAYARRFSTRTVNLYGTIWTVPNIWENMDINRHMQKYGHKTLKPNFTPLCPIFLVLADIEEEKSKHRKVRRWNILTRYFRWFFIFSIAIF